ncbi:MAG: hypothetical protein HFE29_04120 [Clostridia bacterium]|nr:hypothetical protein [Clostridia bacterium]
MFYYIEDKEIRSELRLACEEIILNVQKSFLRDYFTFEFKLIGSGETRLITRNGNTGEFDLDYNFILQKDKQGLISNPRRIKELFIEAFNEVNPNLGFKPANNSKSVITSRLVRNNRLYFSFDVAILCEGNNGNYYKIIYDKPSDRYLWNEVKSSRGYQNKLIALKKYGKWLEIKTIYLKKKNMYLCRNIEKSSFSILLETLNELCDRYGIRV